MQGSGRGQVLKYQFPGLGHDDGTTEIHSVFLFSLIPAINLSIRSSIAFEFHSR